jgi:hypothetical protein
MSRAVLVAEFTQPRHGKVDGKRYEVLDECYRPAIGRCPKDVIQIRHRNALVDCGANRQWQGAYSEDPPSGETRDISLKVRVAIQLKEVDEGGSDVTIQTSADDFCSQKPAPLDIHIADPSNVLRCSLKGKVSVEHAEERYLNAEAFPVDTVRRPSDKTLQVLVSTGT